MIFDVWVYLLPTKKDTTLVNRIYWSYDDAILELIVVHWQPETAEGR